MHIIDLAPFDDQDPAKAALSLIKELEKFDQQLLDKPRWVVFNKLDLMPESEWQEKTRETLKLLNWEGPWYSISAVDGRGTDKLCTDIMQYIEEKREQLQEQEKTLTSRNVTYPEPTLESEAADYDDEEFDPDQP